MYEYIGDDEQNYRWIFEESMTKWVDRKSTNPTN